jgi:chemotaxis protein methyltransferase CheR
MTAPDRIQILLQSLIETRSGISQQTQQRSGIASIIDMLADDSPVSLLNSLRQQPTESALWQRLIQLLTISETYFLRDRNHFRILRDDILPELIRARRQAADLQIRLVSVGCSTGEELYSIATTLYDLLPDVSAWELALHGADINQQAIQTARAGVYREWSFRQVPAHYQQRYFTPVDAGWQVIEPLREMVSFQAGNLLDKRALLPDAAGTPRADVIFCRHVLMYIGDEATRTIEQHLFDGLKPGGWLFLGQAEALRFQRERWTMHLYPGTPVYQKPATASASANSAESYTPLNRTETPAEATAHYQSAVQALHQEQTADAEYHLARLLDALPDHARGHTLLAALFANRQAYPEAEAHLNAALSSEPLLADAHYIRGVIALETGDYTRSMQALQAARYCQKNHHLAAFTLGTVYRERGQVQKAVRLWRNLQPALKALDTDAFLSDVSEMRAGTLRGLLAAHLDATSAAPDTPHHETD